MASIQLSVIIGLASLLIITVSAVLQYISHRHDVVDSRFEREQKIKEQLGKEKIVVEGFTEDDYDISVRMHDVDVKERSGIVYALKKIAIPTADIDGTTVVKMGIKPENEIPLGMYTIEGWEDNAAGLRGVVLRIPNANDMITIEIDTVDPYEVPPTLSNSMGLTDHLKLVDKADKAEEFGQLMQDISTPTTEPYS